MVSTETQILKRVSGGGSAGPLFYRLEIHLVLEYKVSKHSKFLLLSNQGRGTIHSKLRCPKIYRMICNLHASVTKAKNNPSKTKNGEFIVLIPILIE